MSLNSETTDAALMSEAKSRAPRNEAMLEASAQKKSFASQLGTGHGKSTEFCKSEQQKFECHPPIDEIMGLLLSSSDSSPASLVRAYETSMNNLNDPAIATIAAFCLIQGVGCMPNPEAALSILTRHQDEPRAKALLAECYIFGKGVGQDMCLGVELLECAEKAGDLYAYLVLGDCYRLGMINPGMPDLEKAIEEYQCVLESKESYCDTNLMKCLTHMQLAQASEDAAMLDHLREAAKFGYPPAQYELGRVLLDEAETDEHHQTAMVEFERAAEARYLPACLFLARGWSKYTATADHNLPSTLFSESDLHKAFKYYLYAAEQRPQELQEFAAKYRWEIGIIPGGLEDVHQIVEMLSMKAQNQNDVDAQVNLGLCYYFGYGGKRGDEHALEWFLKAANQGHAYGEFWVGRCYHLARGIDQDYKRSVEWYQRCANQGNAYGQCNLGTCYYNGQGVTRDYERAVEWYQKAANQGDAYAQYHLGNCYKNGQGVTYDDQQAFEWYFKSARQGNMCSQYDLGICYEYGECITQDYKVALEWYRRAGYQGHRSAQFRGNMCKGLGVAHYYRGPLEWSTAAERQGIVNSRQFSARRYTLGGAERSGPSPTFIRPLVNVPQSRRIRGRVTSRTRPDH